MGRCFSWEMENSPCGPGRETSQGYRSDQTFDLSLRPCPDRSLPQTFKASWAGSIQMLETGKSPVCTASHVVNQLQRPQTSQTASPLCLSLHTASQRPRVYYLILNISACVTIVKSLACRVRFV